MKQIKSWQGIGTRSGRLAVAAAFVFSLVLTGRLGAVASAATTWYVSPSGSDKNSCMLLTAPCATIGAAIVKSAAGDSIKIGPGSYFERLSIAKNLNLVGAGIGVTLLDGAHYDPAHDAPLISIITGTVNIANMTLQNNRTRLQGGAIANRGITTLVNSMVANNYTSAWAGGIYNHGTMIIISSTVTGGTSMTAGGGIVNQASLTLIRSAVTNNRAMTANAGGIANGGAMTITQSTVSGNSATSGAAGIDSFGSSMAASIISSTINGNNGDGLYIDGLMTIGDSTISRNSGSGVRSDGGLRGIPSVLRVYNSTFSDNREGLYNNGATVSVWSGTFSGNVSGNGRTGGVTNVSGTFNLVNTLVAGNSGGSGGGSPDCSGTFISGGYNLLGDRTGCTGFVNGVKGDQVGMAGSPLHPRLAPLQDNGGRTLTRALLPGSPAINRGQPECIIAPGRPLKTDQRGVARPYPVGGRCDIGAYEYSPLALGTPTSMAASTTMPTPMPTPSATATITHRG